MTLTSFRSANDNDIEFLVELVNSAYQPSSGAGGWTDETRYVEGRRTSVDSMAKLLSKPDSVLLLGLKDGQIIATAHLEKKADHVHIGMLAVSPAWQGQGIGKQILGYAENYAAEHFQANKLAMIVIALRHDVISFYQRRGYRLTGKTIPYAFFCGDTCDEKIVGMAFAELEKPVLVQTPS